MLILENVDTVTGGNKIFREPLQVKLTELFFLLPFPLYPLLLFYSFFHSFLLQDFTSILFLIYLLPRERSAV